MGEQQVGHVGACDDQDGRGCSEQEPEQRPRVSDGDIEQVRQEDRPARIRSRVRVGEPARDDVEFRAGRFH